MIKEESKIMKGVAILLMLYGHLFFLQSDTNLCTCFVNICGKPLVELLTRASNPVAFFLILSGYGLYIVENNNNYNIIKKIRNLYVHYWITLFIFVPLGAFIAGTDKYPGSWINIISNVTAWGTTWNAPIWFFFPYMLLSLSSRFLFRLLDRLNAWLFMCGSLFLTFVAMFCISRYGDSYFFNHQLVYMPILYLDCLFPFTAGAWMAKYNIVEKLRDNSLKLRGYRCWILLILLIAFRCCFETGAFHTFYAIAFIILFVNASRWKWVDNFLSEMGKRATSMWFVHMYFCGYLFHDFFYSFRYPIVIFSLLVGCSYISALVIDHINAKVQTLISK